MDERTETTGDDADTRTAAAADGAARVVHRVVLGVFAAVYLALAIGWVLVVADNGTALGAPLAEGLYLVGLGFAVLAAPLWFVASMLLARSAQSRVLWMLVGVVVLLPWPAVIGL
ncbi:hypothetical protein [Herbiconiux sp. L3-i23]|uniref:hypothetical protein n=1 Tax=Herbiconiux sp. L3-i23 TaxID=2905871 RepID=UPI002051D41C|nr:hypothetical protein [Herbiconiux sp. L3-i23]BDI21764.1 hypothetical protein L3i23_05400 [Herbiconiux sp. L3-i23]